MKVLTQLPWRTRLRLFFTHRVDATAIWLNDRGHWQLAKLTWQVTGPVDWAAEDAPAPVTEDEQHEAALAWKERARQLREAGGDARP